MTDQQAKLRRKDVANAAVLLLDAVEGVPRDIATVSTPYGRVDVVIDDEGVDVMPHAKTATVHVRFDA